MSRTDAVILAGGKTDAEWRAATGVEDRALVQWNGEPMYQHVLNAIRHTPNVGNLFVAGSVPPHPDYQIVRPGSDLIETVWGAVQASRSEAVLFSTVDLPFLTTEAVTYFLSESERSGAAVCYAIVPADLCRKRFPTMKRTTVRLREGEFTGGNLFWAKREVVLQHLPRLRALYQARKQPIRMAMVVGIGILIRLILAKLISPNLISIDDVERRARRLLGVPGKAIISPYAEIGTDIDSLQHWQAAKGMRDEGGIKCE